MQQGVVKTLHPLVDTLTPSPLESLGCRGVKECWVCQGGRGREEEDPESPGSAHLCHLTGLPLVTRLGRGAGSRGSPRKLLPKEHPQQNPPDTGGEVTPRSRKKEHEVSADFFLVCSWLFMHPPAPIFLRLRLLPLPARVLSLALSISLKQTFKNL